MNLFEKYKNKCFVETGSYKGDGIQKAIDAGFDKIISIEITPKYYKLCKEKFQNNISVEVIEGDSVQLLKSIISKIDEPITFWLDGHYVDETTKFGDKLCPILDEIDIIKDHVVKYGDTVLINDLRCWNKANFFYRHYKFDVNDIINNLKFIDKYVKIDYEDGFVKNDILVAQFAARDIEEKTKPIKKIVKKRSGRPKSKKIK